MEKRYYWLKLKEDFFEQKEIKRLRKIAGGDTYTIIYLKMLLKSLKNNGFLYFEGIENNFIDELALDIDEDEDNVRITVEYLISKGILESKTEDEYVLLTASEMTGSESAAAKRMRKSRLKERNEITEERNNVTHICNNVTEERNNVTHICNNVTSLLQPVTKRYTEIDIEKDIEKRNIYNVEQNSLKNEYKEIISYLNKKVGTNYKVTAKATQEAIKARLNEGFTVDDFKTVIDTMCSKWLNNDEMSQYLRPITLFGTKFESYLNTKPTTKTNNNNNNGFGGVDLTGIL